MYVEVEIDADAFEEVIGQRNEPHFDGDLQILHASQLIEEIGDLLVNFLGLADDEAQVRFKSLDGAFTAVFGPGFRFDGIFDQVDDRSPRSAWAPPPNPPGPDPMELPIAAHSAGPRHGWRIFGRASSD